MTAPVAGTPAPDFTLDTTAGSPVTLSSFKGKKNVLIAFYPLAFTSTCTAELCAFTNDFEAFTAKDVEVIPVSVDAVPSLKVYKRQQNLSVELASDSISTSYARDATRLKSLASSTERFCCRL